MTLVPAVRIQCSAIKNTYLTVRNNTRKVLGKVHAILRGSLPDPSGINFKTVPCKGGLHIYPVNMEKSPRVTEAENPERVSAVSPNPLSSIINVYGYSKFGIAKSMQLSGLMS